jgi:hypothetical protein
MGISFLKKSDFHLSNGVFAIFCHEISATALAGRFCVARGTCVEGVTQKFRLSRCLFPHWYYLFSVALLNSYKSAMFEFD